MCIRDRCKTLQSQDVGHVVMEDLDNSFGRCYTKDKDNEDINYNRKVDVYKRQIILVGCNKYVILITLFI